MTKHLIVTCEEFVKPFIERGVIPANSRRIIIDAEVGKPVRLIYETFAETPVIDALLKCDLSVREGN